MDHKELYKKAFSVVRETYPCSDHETAFNNVKERAKNMKKEATADNSSHPGLIEITPVRAEPKKGIRIIQAVVGIAGAAAVLAGAVFGIRYLNEYGGLKEGGSYGPGAASGGAAAQNVYKATSPDNAEHIDISELAGKQFEFSTHTVTVERAEYDGQFVIMTYTSTREKNEDIYSFKLEPVQFYGSTGSESVYYLNQRVDGDTSSITVVREYPLPDNYTLDLAPISMSSSTERINDLVVTISRGANRTVMQPVLDNDDIDEHAKLCYMFISPRVLELSVSHDSSFDCTSPVVRGIKDDGSAVELSGVSGFGYGNGEEFTTKFCYIADETETVSFTEMKAFEVNGKQFEVTEQPVITTTAVVTAVGDPYLGTEVSAYAVESTTATAESFEDTTTLLNDHYEMNVSDGMLDHTDVSSALDEGSVKILPGRIYCGGILKLRLEGDIDDDTRLGVRSVTDPRSILQGARKNDDGTMTLWALLNVPDGETESLELIDLGAVTTDGRPKAIEVINISGNNDYEPLTERVGLDMTQFGIPDETLEWLTLSPFGLELSFTSDKPWKSPEIKVEWTSLNGTVERNSGSSGMEKYDESTGKYNMTLLIVPDENDVDLTQMKEFFVNGLKTKRSEFMPKSFWDIPESENEMTPIETAVQVLPPEE